MANKPNVLPTETTNGSYEGRETYLASCRCSNPNCTRPTSYFVNTDELCPEQTAELRGDDLGTKAITSPEEALDMLVSLAMAGDPEAIKLLLSLM